MNEREEWIIADMGIINLINEMLDADEETIRLCDEIKRLCEERDGTMKDLVCELNSEIDKLRSL